MIGWAALKLLMGGFLKTVAGFVRANYRWLLPLLAALFLWWYIANLQGQRDDAVQALETHLLQDQAAAEKRREENRLKEAQVATAFNQVIGTHTAEIDQIRKDYDAKHQTQQAAADRTIAGWRERVRLELQRQAAAGLPDLSFPAEGAACQGANGDATAARHAYDTLALACKVTTSDYNALHQAWSEACAIHGCR